MRAFRIILGFVVAATLVCLCSYPFDYAAFYLMRCGYQFLEAVGVMNTAGNLGGQVVGHNYYREPQWVHAPLRAIATWIACAPLLVSALLVYHRLAVGPLGLCATLCGTCSRSLTGTATCKCGHRPQNESPALLASRLAALLGPARARGAKQLAIALFAAGAVTFVFYIRDYSLWNIRGWIIEVLKRLGGQVTYMGRMPWPDPFFGDHAGLYNAIAMHGPRVVVVLSEFAAATVVYHLLVCSARPRYRGATLCGRCRYHLAGVGGTTCPECGTTFGALP